MAPVYLEPANPIGAGLNAFANVQQAQAARARNVLINQEMKREQQKRNALQQYGQTRDMNALWQADPETAMAAEKFVAGMDDHKRKALAADIDIFDAMKGHAVNDPEIYKRMYESGSPEFRKYLTSPEDFAKLTPEQREEELYHREKLAAAIKSAPSWYQKERIKQEGRKIDLMQTPQQKQQDKKDLIDYRVKREGESTVPVVNIDTRGIPVTVGNVPKGAKVVKQTGGKSTEDMAWKDALNKADVQIRSMQNMQSTDTRLQGKTPEQIETFRQNLAKQYYNERKAGPGATPPSKTETGGGEPPYPPNQPPGTTATGPDGTIWETDGKKWTKKAGR